MQPDPRTLALARHISSRSHAARLEQHRAAQLDDLWAVFAAVSVLLVAVSIVALAVG